MDEEDREHVLYQIYAPYVIHYVTLTQICAYSMQSPILLLLVSANSSFCCVKLTNLAYIQFLTLQHFYPNYKY